MKGIQILLLVIVLMIAVYIFTRMRNRIADIILLGVLVIAAVVFIIFPGWTFYIANSLGVGRGADLVFYVSILTFWFVILKLYARVRRLEQLITKIARKEAIETAEETSAKK
jgi:small membrane protein